MKISVTHGLAVAPRLVRGVHRSVLVDTAVKPRYYTKVMGADYFECDKKICNKAEGIGRTEAFF